MEFEVSYTLDNEQQFWDGMSCHLKLIRGQAFTDWTQSSTI
jgi:hypothetical protein